MCEHVTCSCIEKCLSARASTLVNQGNFALTCVSIGTRDLASRRGARAVRLVRGVLFALVSVAVVHCILVPWREYQFYRGRARALARADPRILRLIREDRVVFVSVYALGVCTSASGLWHFLDYLNI